MCVFLCLWIGCYSILLALSNAKIWACTFLISFHLFLCTLNTGVGICWLLLLFHLLSGFLHFTHTCHILLRATATLIRAFFPHMVKTGKDKACAILDRETGWQCHCHMNAKAFFPPPLSIKSYWGTFTSFRQKDRVLHKVLWPYFLSFARKTRNGYRVHIMLCEERPDRNQKCRTWLKLNLKASLLLITKQNN